MQSNPRMKVKSRFFATALVSLLMLPASALLAAEGAPATWDDLQLVKSSKYSRLYLLPGADFQPYSKIMLDPTEASFRKDWVRNYNQSSRELSRRISDDDVNRVIQQVSSNFGDIFAEEYQKAGYQVVQTPGPDVLRVKTGVIDMEVSAPDVRTASRSYSASWEAGQATLFVEARDSQTGALLGRVLDRRLAGDNQPYLRNSVTNKADFKILFRRWAKDSIEGLNRLKGGGSVTAQK